MRILFTDLNLAELGGVPDTPTLWATVVGVLKQIVSKDSGPYLLVFWTRVGAKAEEVKKMLYERKDALDGIPCPIEVLDLPKAEFLVAPPKAADFNDALREFYTALHANLDNLKSAVTEAVGANANLTAVSAWESRAADAASLAVNEVDRCARTDETDPAKVNGSLTKVLAKIAVAASGTSAAQAEPARALDAGMIDILVDQFGATVDDPAYKNAVGDAIGGTVIREIEFVNPVEMYAELNTFFHVDRQVTTTQSWDRGVVIPARHPMNGNMLGFNVKDLITSEFLFPAELFPEPGRDAAQALLREFRASAEVVLVEVGADCDHAQNHDRTRRYLVGLEVPEKFAQFIRLSDGGNLRNGSLECLGPWKVDATTTYLLVSCRRYWTWQKGTPPVTPAARYRLRATLVDKLLHRYSAWNSRPGIVEFR
ncbi:hypothetical protein ACQUJS_13785 [Ralstonia pseudosolanacearum]